MSISQLFPTSRPSLNLNFARSKTLDPRITFTRSSTGTYVGSDGLIKIASADQPRFDHDPVTGESLGLLIEEQRSNLLTYSEDYSTWILEGTGSVTKNVTGPDGIPNSAFTIEDNDSAGDFIRFYKETNITPSSITNYCISSFIKPISTTNVDLYCFFLGNSVKGSLVNYNFSTDTLSVSSSDGGGITPTIYGRIQYPNGWIRIYFVVNDANNGLNSTLQYRIYPANRNAGTTGSIGLYGSQIEIGSFPTSYIPTTTSTVTRTADYPRMTGTNFSSWFNSSEGTLYSEIYFRNGIEGSEFPTIVNSTGSAYIGSYTYTSNAYFEYYNTSSNVVSISTPLSSGSQFKSAQAYKNQDFAVALDGTIIGTDSSNISFATDHNELLLGYWRVVGDNNFHINGHIKSCTYYPTRLPNDQLQNLTK